MSDKLCVISYLMFNRFWFIPFDFRYCLNLRYSQECCMKKNRFSDGAFV